MFRLANSFWVLACKSLFSILGFIVRFMFKSEEDGSSQKIDCNFRVDHSQKDDNIDSAWKMFDEIGERDLVSWNSLICGYSQSNRFQEVLGLFDAMRAANVKADAVTMVKVILACSHLGNREKLDFMVKYIADDHVEIDVYLGNTLIDMYGRIGSVGLALCVQTAAVCVRTPVQCVLKLC